jgi:hypothetical protein
LVGYREDTFRDLVKRLTDVILAPGGGAVAVAPVISGVTPGAGLAAGGESVTIKGTGLLGATAVRFGSALALFTVESDTQVSARTPPGQAGSTVGVAVVTPGGSATFSPFSYK